ncbi:hypothetical protein NX02_07725 [Sphingomonas sanxanigenens DSM 19645 = NX02]|uniref:Uncharacterized protein n=1 Tax=Sphingomonas sanxanigenens DSM 19645 = NX02 TaxID=1123269 RepID=W0AC61_9SPHN|nr:hypothetical protein NX02_07725 [Sphingomonas sanxanigenens DSM 19645 = NX02]
MRDGDGVGGCFTDPVSPLMRRSIGENHYTQV